ncbi:MAG: hypothetical protein IPJ71_12000 [Bdellovibrionales bacterium]|nr:hypothetical protein [Bdellovibrionales bacterium]
MKKHLILATTCILMSPQSFASEFLSGDTLGAAQSNLSSVGRKIKGILNPQEVVDQIGDLDNNQISRAVCSQLGSAVGYAFAVNMEVQLFTQFSKKTESESSRILAEQINVLIDLLTTANNGFCLGKSLKLNDVHTAALAAQRTTDYLIALIGRILEERKK